MRGPLLRRLLPAVLVLVAVLLAVRPFGGPAPEPAPATVPFARLPDGERVVATRLWEAWHPDLAPDSDGEVPVELGDLGYVELVYVLLTVRAAQVARAVAEAPDADVAAAVGAAGLAPSPDGLTTALVPGQPGCVVLRLEAEPFGRDYYGLADAPDLPGPSPASAVEAVLLRTARVGIGESDAQSCGQGTAYSPAAQAALRALAPRGL